MVRSSIANRQRQNPRRSKATLVLKGYTMTSFAEAFGFSLSTVKAAIRGERFGPKSQRVIETIRSAPPVQS